MKALLTAAVLIPVLAMPALANQPGEHEGHGGRAAMMERYDTNKDGKIDKAEFMAAAADRFAKLDTGNRGSVSQSDFAEAVERAAQQRRAERKTKMFQRLDANSDGVLTREEFLAAAEKRFSRLDRDGDGTLSPTDRRARGDGAQSGTKQ